MIKIWHLKPKNWQTQRWMRHLKVDGNIELNIKWEGCKRAFISTVSIYGLFEEDLPILNSYCGFSRTSIWSIFWQDALDCVYLEQRSSVVTERSRTLVTWQKTELSETCVSQAMYTVYTPAFHMYTVYTPALHMHQIHLHIMTWRFFHHTQHTYICSNILHDIIYLT